MTTVYVILLAHVILAAVGAPAAWWVWNEARKDHQRYSTADREDLLIVARMRRRTTGGVFVAQCGFLVGGLIMLYLVYAYRGTDDARWAFWMLLMVASLRVMVAELTLLWVSFSSRAGRKRLRAYTAVPPVSR